ncbi:MAG TPA: S-adenosyl-l-methionine hydroxide adenosyltransferase family protein, partial [Candidatus Synoicihabitans sp.]|nr:S-adenosyl-l-methionine hydroxide adenosyltransferase family protein [Candidatus Synoicihabitans sp.]
MLPRSLALWFLLALPLVAETSDMHALVLQTDFGQADGAVAAMKGVAVGVERRLPIHDLSHENTPFDIWEAAYRLKQTAAYWPAGTVFVSVIDPGVGTARSSVVLETKSGHYFVSPDNGTLTLVAEDLGIAAVRRIDERSNRLAGSEKSYTFHGRDVYAYTGARLAAGQITFEEVGPLLPPEVVRIPHARAERRGNTIVGNIPMLDRNYGNVWTNIPDALLTELGVKIGDRVRVRIAQAGRGVFDGEMPYVPTFGSVPEGAPLLYLNSLLNVAVALNQRNFAATHDV